MSIHRNEMGCLFVQCDTCSTQYHSIYTQDEATPIVLSEAEQLGWTSVFDGDTWEDKCYSCASK